MSQSALIMLIDKRKEKQRINPLVLRRSWYQKLLRHVLFSVPGSALVPIAVIYVDPKEILFINTRYRGGARATDVLSFAYTTHGILSEGEIVLCPEIAIRQHARFRTTIEKEFARLFFHGVLHVYGYDHCTAAQKKVMSSLEHCLLRSYDKTSSA